MPIKRTPIPKTYWFLVFIRFALVLIPQSGYIHPDEYFQSVEVLAGKFLNVEATVPWEFNSSFPLRSMALPYFTIGFSIKILKDISYLVKEYLSLNIMSPYVLLVTPRLMMCCFSLITDYCLYKICAYNNERAKSRLILLASSYVTIVFGTRTFSNTFELVLFSMLLYYVSESLTYSNMLIKKREYLNYRYEKTQDPVERAKFHKLRLLLKDDSVRNAREISIVTVLGFFNRPTFLAFAVVPIFFWLYRGIGTKTINALVFHMRIVTLMVMAIPTMILIIIIDSFYYGYISWGEIGMLDISINSFVFTPLNFVKYNIDLENLAEHGIHPKYLHALVNIPLLFNVLAVCVFGRLLVYAYHIYIRKYHLLPTVRSIKGLMNLTFVLPVTLLSFVPHQEPRFLIPLIIPLVYLHGPTILSETDDAVIRAPSVTRNVSARVQKPSHFLLKVWLVINTLFVIFYGFIHQGGVFKATQYLSNELQTSPYTEIHVVTSHIYSLPQAHLLQKSTNKIYTSGNAKFVLQKKFFLYEEGSKDVALTVKKIRIILLSVAQEKLVRPNKNFKVYLLIPSSLNKELEKAVRPEDIIMMKRETFFPHVSIEAFPKMTDYCLDIYNLYMNKRCFKGETLPFYTYIYKFVQRCGLNLFEFDLDTTSVFHF